MTAPTTPGRPADGGRTRGRRQRPSWWSCWSAAASASSVGHRPALRPSIDRGKPPRLGLTAPRGRCMIGPTRTLGSAEYGHHSSSPTSGRCETHAGHESMQGPPVGPSRRRLLGALGLGVPSAQTGRIFVLRRLHDVQPNATLLDAPRGHDGELLRLDAIENRSARAGRSSIIADGGRVTARANLRLQPPRMRSRLSGGTRPGPPDERRRPAQRSGRMVRRQFAIRPSASRGLVSAAPAVARVAYLYALPGHDLPQFAGEVDDVAARRRCLHRRTGPARPALRSPDQSACSSGHVDAANPRAAPVGIEVVTVELRDGTPPVHPAARHRAAVVVGVLDPRHRVVVEVAAGQQEAASSFGVRPAEVRATGVERRPG